jgi:hypothetical protein
MTGYAPDDLTSARPDGSGTPIPGRRTAFDNLADQAALATLATLLLLRALDRNAG